jgi:hypothetical protein
MSQELYFVRALPCAVAISSLSWIDEQEETAARYDWIIAFGSQRESEEVPDGARTTPVTPRKPDRRDAEGARAYAIENAVALDQWAALFMTKLGIENIGASDRQNNVEWRAFFPLEGDGGGNSPGERLNLDSGLFNDDLMLPVGPRADKAWRRASVETRAMAVLPHEEIESRGHTHEEAVEMAPDTELPITHAARELLRIIREEQRRKLRER